MKKLILMVFAALALVTVGAATAAAESDRAACTSGPTTYKGARAKTWCGPASAVVKLGGRTLRYKTGTCLRNSVALELNIGTAILDAKDPKGPLPTHFGVAVGRIFGIGKAAPRDGTYPGAAVVLVDGGKRYASMTAEVVLSGGRTRGTFAGSLLGGPSFSGSFRCS